MDISAVILTWNSEKYIEKCLTSLFKDAMNSNISLAVHVVDNGSTDKTLDILRDLHLKYSGFEVIELDRNYGTTHSRNIAIAKSESDYVLILDSDTEVKPGALKILIDTFSKVKNAGIVAPRLLYPDGSIQPSFKKIPTATIKLFKGLPLKKLNDIGVSMELYDKKYYEPEFKELFEPEYCISACWMVDRKAIRKVGLLDEHIFYAPEDVDYCLRMWLNGYKVIYNPTAEVIHYTQRVSHKSKKLAILHVEGLLYYFWKYKYLFSKRRIYNKIRNNENKYEER